MSYATDVLMYVDACDGHAMETFNSRLAETTRFGAHPDEVDTSDFSGPNVFGGQVWAFGADYLSPDDVQTAIDSVLWRYPHRVVALVNVIDGDGACETLVCRPHYTISKPDYYGPQTVTQQIPAE